MKLLLLQHPLQLLLQHQHQQLPHLQVQRCLPQLEGGTHLAVTVLDSGSLDQPGNCQRGEEGVDAFAQTSNKTFYLRH